MRASGAMVIYVGTLLICLVSIVTGTYISWKSNENDYGKKSNDVTPVKRYGPPFKSDWDIIRYLKLYGQEMMLWRCRNAIQPYWEWKPLPVVELYCEAIGRLKKVEWYHNGQKLEIDAKYIKGAVRKGTHPGGRYGQLIVPHYANGRYFAKWIDFRLKIYNATLSDSGIYTFKAVSPSGQTEEQVIYVDISEKKKKKRNSRNSRKQGRRNRRQHHRTRSRGRRREPK